MAGCYPASLGLRANPLNLINLHHQEQHQKKARYDGKYYEPEMTVISPETTYTGLTIAITNPSQPFSPTV